MSKFKERLWRDLEREHGSELAQMGRPATGRPRYARPRLLAGTTVGFAVVATAIVLFLSAASTPAAFAVSGNSDGTVSVELRRIAGIKGATRSLSRSASGRSSSRSLPAAVRRCRRRRWPTSRPRTRCSSLPAARRGSTPARFRPRSEERV